MSPQSPPTLSIFQISHILDLICDHLTLQEISFCTHVNREWLTLFSPMLWRECQIDAVPLDKTDCRAFRHNAHRIRYLSIHGGGTMKALALALRPPLRELKIWDGAWALCGPTADAVGKALRDCGKLKRLELVFFSDLAEEAFLNSGEFMKALAGHGHLRTIKLILGNGLTMPHLCTLLRHLPKTVSSLNITLDLDEGAKLEGPGLEDLSMMEWTPFILLRELSFDHDELQMVDPTLVQRVFLPLFRRCPCLYLVRFPPFENESAESVATTLAKGSPDLKVLDMLSQNWTQTSLSWFARLPRLEWISLTLYQATPGTFMSDLIQSSHTTLQALHMDLPDWIPGCEAGSALGSFPNLKTLHFRQSSLLGEGTPLKDLLRQDWICQDLESFQMGVTDPRFFRPLKKDEIKGELCQEVVELHTRLRSLKNLKHLRIDWDLPYYFEPGRKVLTREDLDWVQEHLSGEDLNWLQLGIECDLEDGGGGGGGSEENEGESMNGDMDEGKDEGMGSDEDMKMED